MGDRGVTGRLSERVDGVDEGSPNSSHYGEINMYLGTSLAESKPQGRSIQTSATSLLHARKWPISSEADLMG
jgi:hypothetical protein